MAPEKATPGVDSLMISETLAHDAAEDAGLDIADIDGLVTTGGTDVLWGSTLADYLNLNVRYLDDVSLGGASGCAMLWRAVAAIEAGMCQHVLCVTALSTDPTVQFGGNFTLSSLHTDYSTPYGLGPIGTNSFYAMIAQRHQYEYGTTIEQRAKVAVDQRFNANKNPAALYYDKTLSIEDVINSPMISDPLHLFEIVRLCSGGAAFIVSRANHNNSKNRPVYLLGAGEAIGHIELSQVHDITSSPITAAAKQAFKQAGLTPQEMHFLQPYDCYTIMVIVSLEDIGLCAKGEGGHYVQEHDLTYKGDLPCNTHGGQLSFGQPGLAGGMSHLIEATRQLMGRADERQIPNATLGYVNGNGGVISEECSLILGIEP